MNFLGLDIFFRVVYIKFDTCTLLIMVCKKYSLVSNTTVSPPLVLQLL